MSKTLDKLLFLDRVLEEQRKIVLTTPLLPAVAYLHTFLNREVFVASLHTDASGYHHVLLTEKKGLHVCVLRYNPATSSTWVAPCPSADYRYLDVRPNQNQTDGLYVPNIKNIKRHVNPRTKMGRELHDRLGMAKSYINSIGHYFIQGAYEKLMTGLKLNDAIDVPHFEVNRLPKNIAFQTFAAMRLMGDPVTDFDLIDQGSWAKFKEQYDSFRHDMQVYENALKTAQKIFSYDKWLIGLHDPVDQQDLRTCPFLVGRIPSGMMLNQFQRRAPYADFNWVGDKFDTLDFKLYASVEDMRRDPEVYASVNASLATLRAGRNRQEDIFDSRAYRPSTTTLSAVLWEHLDAMAYQWHDNGMIWIMVDAI